MATQARTSKLVCVFLLGISIVFLSACQSSQNESTNESTSTESAHGHHQDQLMTNGDLRQWTASKDELPSFLDEQRDEIKLIYRLAAQEAELLQSMPCYCGCGDSAGHKSNLNCFVAQINEKNEIEWDDHGTRCGVCLDIAVEASKLKRDGKSASDIRKIIDNKYNEGFAKPTPTPFPKV
ncbi:PCYCGC domain-containing protein [Paenibacillus sp. 481]|uniref:PCYCGC domain-containing protein n=1 Tax=Paenibacillus sp. 481 TaxID=2835869 RepID=UPI001E410855|nr:PCYCGC domain-containing protein [Paenibacillus sp. 481]